MSSKKKPLESKPPDDDPNTDWETEGGATIADPTVVATAEPVTAPHDLTTVAAGLELEIARGRDEGYRKGFADGQADAVGAFALTFDEKGLTRDQTRNILLAAEGKLTRI
jgi:hypothetical protein